MCAEIPYLICTKDNPPVSLTSALSSKLTFSLCPLRIVQITICLDKPTRTLCLIMNYPCHLDCHDEIFSCINCHSGEFTSFTLRIRGSMALQKTLFMHNCRSEEILPFTLSFSGSVNSSSKCRQIAHPTFMRSRK